jgi:hypothetical protein
MMQRMSKRLWIFSESPHCCRIQMLHFCLVNGAALPRSLYISGHFSALLLQALRGRILMACLLTRTRYQVTACALHSATRRRNFSARRVLTCEGRASRVATTAHGSQLSRVSANHTLSKQTLVAWDGGAGYELIKLGTRRSFPSTV